MEKLLPILTYLLNRAKEPSTWVAIAAFLGFFGISSDTATRVSENGVSIAAAVATILAIFLPEFKAKPKPEDEFKDPR